MAGAAAGPFQASIWNSFWAFHSIPGSVHGQYPVPNSKRSASFLCRANSSHAGTSLQLLLANSHFWKSYPYQFPILREAHSISVWCFELWLFWVLSSFDICISNKAFLCKILSFAPSLLPRHSCFCCRPYQLFPVCHLHHRSSWSWSYLPSIDRPSISYHLRTRRIVCPPTFGRSYRLCISASDVRSTQLPAFSCLAYFRCSPALSPLLMGLALSLELLLHQHSPWRRRSWLAPCTWASPSCEPGRSEESSYPANCTGICSIAEHIESQTTFECISPEYVVAHIYSQYSIVSKSEAHTGSSRSANTLF